MYEWEERQFEAKAEREFKGQRELLPGRDFRYNVFRFRDEDDTFRQRYDETFPDAPGSPQWWARKFGGN